MVDRLVEIWGPCPALITYSFKMSFAFALSSCVALRSQSLFSLSRVLQIIWDVVKRRFRVHAVTGAHTREPPEVGLRWRGRNGGACFRKEQKNSKVAGGSGFGYGPYWLESKEILPKHSSPMMEQSPHRTKWNVISIQKIKINISTVRRKREKIKKQTKIKLRINY